MTSPNNPFIKYKSKIEGNPIQEEIPQQENPVEEKKVKANPFFELAKKKKEVEFPYENENDLEREIEKNQAIGTSRIAESVLGAPGDIASFFTGLFGEEQKVLPTSKNLQDLSEKATLGYTKPENESQKVLSELSSDIGSMMIPGSGHYSFARNIGVPVVANLVKEGLKYSDSGEEAQAYGKVGTMIALDLISRRQGGVKKYMDDLFDKAKESIPKGVSVNASTLKDSLNALEGELKKGGSRKSTTNSLEKITELNKDIKNGKIDVSTLAAYRPSINEAIADLGGFSSSVPIKYRPQAIRNLNNVKDKVIKTLTSYGEKFNPEFLKFHKEANESYAAYSTSNKIAKFLQDKVGYIPKSKAVQSLFDYGGLTAITGLATMGAPAAAAATLAAGGYQGFKILNRVINSPTLAKYYANVLKEAAAGNVTATTKNLKALDINMGLHDQDSHNHDQIEQDK